MTFEEIIENATDRECFGGDIGIKITELSKGHCIGEINLEKKHLNHYQTVHGGCLFSLADTVGGCAALTYGKNVVTVSSNMNFINPAMDAHKLIAEAIEVKCGSKIAVYDVILSTDSNVKVATSTLSYFILD